MNVLRGWATGQHFLVTALEPQTVKCSENAGTSGNFYFILLKSPHESVNIELWPTVRVHVHYFVHKMS